MDNECSLKVEERLPKRGYLVFGLWTLPNIRPRRCFEDQILHTNCAENLGSWSGSSLTRPRIHRLRLCYHHTLVIASFLFHEKTSFAKVFLSFRGRFREKLPSQKHLCLTLYFSGNDGALLPRLARLLTLQSPLKRLVLKFPIILSRPTQWFVHLSPQYSHITLVSEYPFDSCQFTITWMSIPIPNPTLFWMYFKTIFENCI